QSRHDRLLKNNLRVNTETWGLIDPAGRSELGFWPLFIGQQHFMLVISGTPRLQDQSFVTLVQDLDTRYR
ncbi:MAG: roadblock/LC7 domain-containing protein, partial [Acidithiobacillus sp.]